MKPALGWTQFSRQALRRAESSILDKDQGVRDEIGFLLLHQAYADRFFPGTSVLQTRLRYILFIPWIYERIASQAHKRSVDELLREEELRLIVRLKKHYHETAAAGDGAGIIGRRSHDLGRLTTQPSSMIYWSALGRWGFLKRMADGTLPSRTKVHRALRHRQVSTRLTDDDSQPIFDDNPLFVALPGPPPGWDKFSEPLSFDFPNDVRDERGFIVRHLVGVERPGSLSEPSLLARLADNNFDPTTCEEAWDHKIVALADRDDTHALSRARQAAAISAIGRGVYAALVEQLRSDDGLETAHIHRDYLDQMIHDFKEDALSLDVGAIRHDAPGIDIGILEILNETKSWMSSQRTFLDLRDVYAAAEVRRKGSRARLSDNYGGQKRRAEWFPDEHALAYPLHYRWSNVRRLLLDLRGQQ